MRSWAASSHQEGRSCRPGWTRRVFAPVQQWVPGLHRQEVKSLGLIMAGKNSLFPPNIKVMFLISLLLWSHHWGTWALSIMTRCTEQLRHCPCSTPPGNIQKQRGGETQRVCLLRVYERHCNRNSLFLSHLNRRKCYLAPRMKYWF